MPPRAKSSTRWSLRSASELTGPVTSGAPGKGWLARDEHSDQLNLALEDEEGTTLQQLQGHWITYRIATGPHAGRKSLSVQTTLRSTIRQIAYDKQVDVAVEFTSWFVIRDTQGIFHRPYRLGQSEFFTRRIKSDALDRIPIFGYRKICP